MSHSDWTPYINCSISHVMRYRGISRQVIFVCLKTPLLWITACEKIEIKNRIESTQARDYSTSHLILSNLYRIFKLNDSYGRILRRALTWNRDLCDTRRATNTVSNTFETQCNGCFRAECIGNSFRITQIRELDFTPKSGEEYGRHVFNISWILIDS